MWTLALETTSNHGSLALLDDERLHTVVALEARAYAVSVFEAAASVLKQAQLQLDDIGLFAVADGPGSFTGVRIGLTAVKGWIEVLEKPAVAVSTLRAAAAAAWDQPVLSVLDASRNEVFYGIYPHGARQEGSDSEEGLESVDAFRARRAQAGSAWRVLTADAALAVQLEGVEQAPMELAPAVGRLGRAAWCAGQVGDGLRLDARYIRRPDAQVPTGLAALP